MERRSKLLVASSLLLALVVAGWSGLPTAAQEAAEKPAAKTRAKPRGRLPAYYAQVVSNEQRESIYKIQQTYAEQIEQLEAQLKALIEKRDGEIRAVLTPEQLKKVDELAAAAKEQRAETKQTPAKQGPPANGEQTAPAAAPKASARPGRTP